MSQIIRPNLMDASVTEKIINARSDSETSAEKTSLVKDLKTDTKTDMQFQYFANEHKLVDEEQRRFFNNTNNIDILSDSNKSIDSRTSKISKASKSSKNSIKTIENKYDGPEPKGSVSGPSFGSGKSFAETKEDKINKNQDEHEEQNIEIKKLELLRQLGELTQQGIKLSQNYNMNSDIKAMEYEYQLHKSIRAKQNGIQFMSNIMLNAVYGLELLNEHYNPFNVNLSGWADHTNREINTYYDVFGELYEKYSGKSNSPPEIKLLLLLVISAGKFAVTNNSFSQESISEKLAKDPQLHEQLRKKAQSDKLKDLTISQQEKLQTYIKQQHEGATQKASDVVQLQNMKKEFQLKEELARKQQELQQLQQQLSESEQSHNQPMHVSDNSVKINPVQIPQRLMRQPQFMNNMNSNNNFDVNQIRQQQIEEQKKRMLEEEMLKNNKAEIQSNGTKVSLSPKLKSLLMSNNDTDSTGSFLENLGTKDNMPIKRKTNKNTKKNNPKVNT